MTTRVCCGYWHMRVRWVTGWTDQLKSRSAERAYHSAHSLQYARRNKACAPRVPMSTPRSHKAMVTDVNKHKPQHQIKDTKTAPLSLFSRLNGHVDSSVSTLGCAVYDFNQSQPVASVFHSHLAPLWPLSSSCPLERDTYSNGLITRGVHFEEVHRDET